MLTCALDHPLELTPARYWELYFDPEVTRRLFEEGLGWQPPAIETFQELPDGDKIRSMSASPRVEVGARVQRIIGKRLGYSERGRFSAETGQWTFQHTTNIFGERLSLGGRMWIDEASSGRGHMYARIDIDCRMPLVGGVLEKAVEVNVRKGYARNAAFFNREFA